MNILYVEDDVEISQLAKTIFVELNHPTLWCHDVNCAINAIDGGGKIDLILLDLKLDKSHGVDLLRYMEKIKSKIPVVVISGQLHSYESEIEYFKKKGMILAVYSKPYSLAYLAKNINSMFPTK
jgi:DNA-binding NtrC family response regulator